MTYGSTSFNKIWGVIWGLFIILCFITRWWCYFCLHSLNLRSSRSPLYLTKWLLFQVDSLHPKKSVWLTPDTSERWVKFFSFIVVRFGRGSDALQGNHTYTTIINHLWFYFLNRFDNNPNDCIQNRHNFIWYFSEWLFYINDII